jgi:hypothetical protein
MLMYIILHNYLHTCDKYRNEIFDFDISIIKDTKGILYELLVRKNRTIRTTIGKFIDNKLIVNSGYEISNHILIKKNNILLYSEKYISEISDCRNRLIEYFCERSFKKVIFEENNNFSENCDLLLIYYLKPIHNFYFNTLNIKYKKCIIIFEDARYIYDSKYNNEIKTLFNNKDIIVSHINKTIYTKLKTLYTNSNIYYYPYVIDQKFNNTVSKEYDILIYGSMNRWAYPFRCKMKNIIFNNMKHSNIKYIEFPGYETKGNKTAIIGEKLHSLISKSKLVLCTSSIFNVLLRKYIEVNYSNTMILGDNIDTTFDKSNILEVNRDMDTSTTIDIINNYLDNYKPSRIKKIYDGRLLFNHFYDDIVSNNYNIYSNNIHSLNSSSSK